MKVVLNHESNEDFILSRNDQTVGLFDAATMDGGPYDVSLHFPNGGINGGHTYTFDSAVVRVPEDLRRGGMSIKYINTSDLYEQYRLTKDEWSTTQSDWTSVDNALAEEITRAQAAEADRYTKAETYSKAQLDNLITTPNVNYVVVSDYASLPSTGAADTIYRVSSYDGAQSQVDVACYSEYAWNGTAYQLLAVKSQVDEVFDISAYRATSDGLAKYDNLSAALDGGNNVPQSLRKGGMSIKFVQSSDNKYVPYRLMSDTFNTTVANWQGVDDEPTAGSDNLVKSGGVYLRINQEIKTAEQHLQESISSVKDETLEENRQMVNSIMQDYAPVEITGDVNNAADEEDLTSVNVGGTDVLKFKDKAYNPLTYSGMGRKILRKNIVDGVNILNQSMMQDTNTIYVIKYDFTLGENITVPANCILEFDGGSLGNGNLVYSNTLINGNYNIDCVCTGSLANKIVYPEMYGAKGDGVTNDAVAIDNCIAGNGNVRFTDFKTYIVSGTLHTEEFDRVIDLHSDLVVDFGKATIKRVESSIIAGVSMFGGYNCSNITLKGGNIVGSIISNPTSFSVDYNSIGINLRKCDNCIIENISISKHWGDGIYLGNPQKECNNIIVENCNISYCFRHGIGVTGCKYSIIKGCDISNIYWLDGIDLEPGWGEDFVDTISIVDCNIHDITYNSGPSHRGIVATRIKNLTIDNCILFNCEGFGESNNSGYIRIYKTTVTSETDINAIFIGSENTSEILIKDSSANSLVLESTNASVTVINCNLQSYGFSGSAQGTGHLMFIDCVFDIEFITQNARVKEFDVIGSTFLIKKYSSGNIRRNLQLSGWKHTSLKHCDLIWLDSEHTDVGGITISGSEYAEVVDCTFDFRRIASTTENGMIILFDKNLRFIGNTVLSESALGGVYNGNLIRLSSSVEEAYILNNVAEHYALMYYNAGSGVVYEANNIVSVSLPVAAPTSGDTASRPVGVHTESDVQVGTLRSSRDIGFRYFDTTLGKPIFVKKINNSTGVVGWVDATGTPV